MRTYIGKRVDTCEVWFIDEKGLSRELPLRLDVRNHSPTGFEWGYGGSGPAQLALALLLNYFETFHKDGNVEAALYLYQRFKFAVVGKLPAEGWSMTTEDIRDFVDARAKEEGEPALVPAEVCMGCSTDLIDGKCPDELCTWATENGLDPTS